MSSVQAVRVTGRVKFFLADKGYGFLTRGEREKDIFVHKNDFPDGVDRLFPDQKVSFTVEETGKGLRARQLRLE